MTFYLHLALGTGATPEWMSNLCSDDYKNYFDHQDFGDDRKMRIEGPRRRTWSPSVVKEAAVIPR